MKSILCIDAGASSSKWAHFQHPNSLRIGKANHITGHIFSDAEWDRTKAEIESIATETGHVENVIFGVTGLDRGTQIAEKLADYCRKRFNADTVQITNDMELAHSAFFQAGEGIILYAGTGAVAVTRTTNGELVRVGGRGFMIADEGGGYWIGREAVRHITRILDMGGQMSDSILASTISENLKLADWNAVRDYVYGGGRQAVAQIAPQVAIAESKGCEHANFILLNSAAELLKLFEMLNKRYPVQKCVALGGVFALSQTIINKVEKEIAIGLEYFNSDIPSQWIRKQQNIPDVKSLKPD